jgi:ornithine cyclodeaminase
MRILNGAEVRALLTPRAALEVMEQALIALVEGRAQAPLRTALAVGPEGRRMGVMPGALATDGFGVKLLSLFPGNAARGLSSHLGLVALFEPDTGRPVALIEASTLTALRTAAVSALATRLMSRPDAGDLALLGSGEQAHSHLAALAEVRTLRRVRVWSRDRAHAQAFADHHGPQVEAAASAAAAVEGADIICTLTASRTPILESRWVADGAHINAVGACTPDAAEVDEALVARSRYVVDLRLSAEAEAGEYLAARAAGAISADHLLGEIGEVAAGRLVPRRDARDVTLFKSLGNAAEDLAAARWVLDRAQAQGIGLTVSL